MRLEPTVDAYRRPKDFQKPEAFWKEIHEVTEPPHCIIAPCLAKVICCKVHTQVSQGGGEEAEEGLDLLGAELFSVLLNIDAEPSVVMRF